MKVVLYGLTRAAGGLLIAAVALMCLFFGYILFCNAVKMPVPKLGPVSFYIVSSDSMSPVLETGDAVFVVRADLKKLKVGDIVVFYAFDGGATLIHRVTEISADAGGAPVFRTKGDNNGAEDDFTTAGADVVGRYLFKLPRFGAYVSDFKGRPYLIVLAAGLFIVLEGSLNWAAKRLKP